MNTQSTILPLLPKFTLNPKRPILTLPSPLAGLRIKETKEVYEGEVTELTPTESENPLSGYGKTVSHVVVGLKTVKGTKQLRLDPTIYEAMLKEKIVVGDVVYVECSTGAVKVCCCFLFLFLGGCIGGFVLPTHLRSMHPNPPRSPLFSISIPNANNPHSA